MKQIYKHVCIRESNKIDEILNKINAIRTNAN